MSLLLMTEICKKSISRAPNLKYNSIRSLSSTLPLTSQDVKSSKSEGFMNKFLGPESSIASKNSTNR